MNEQCMRYLIIEQQTDSECLMKHDFRRLASTKMCQKSLGMADLARKAWTGSSKKHIYGVAVMVPQYGLQSCIWRWLMRGTDFLDCYYLIHFRAFV